MPLKSEIKQIQITWNTFKCQMSCIELIQKNFSAIKEIRNFNMSSNNGMATMNWNPYLPFSYEPFRYAAAAVGISIDSMRLVVTGTISHGGETIFLTSHPEESRFQLLPPLHTESGRQTINRNVENYIFSPELRRKLLDFEQAESIVTVSGPMYMPYYRPNILIIENIKQ